MPPTQNINNDDLVASLLDRSEELISLEIPTDEEPQPGDRVYRGLGRISAQPHYEFYLLCFA